MMQYTVQAIPKTDEGLVFQLSHYKPFRLRALETDPSSFSSNYAREAAFDDEIWRSRLLNPLVTTLVAAVDAGTSTTDIDGSRHRNNNNNNISSPNAQSTLVLSAVTVIGPMPVPSQLQSLGRRPAQLPDKGRDALQRHPTPAPAPLSWEINAVWTAPEARRRGIAQRLLREAVHLVQDQQAAVTAAAGSPTPPAQERQPAAVPELFLTVGVEENNGAALSLYRKSGYIPFPEPVESSTILPDDRIFTWLYLSVPRPDRRS